PCDGNYPVANLPVLGQLLELADLGIYDSGRQKSTAENQEPGQKPGRADGRVYLWLSPYFLHSFLAGTCPLVQRTLGISATIAKTLIMDPEAAWPLQQPAPKRFC